MIANALVFVAYLLTVPAANWMLSNVGVQLEPDGPHLIPVLPGLLAPSGVLMIGVALYLRDAVQDRIGVRAALAAVAIGVAMSWALASPFLAMASAAAFAVSETLDLLVYTPIRSRGWRPAAILASGAVGSVVDSAAFLMIAFGSLDYLLGQVAGKMLITVAVASVVAVAERGTPPVVEVAES
jgi:uncharacterized PurR-regulated membrane protein YhhQ (DUF165 family)